MAVQEVSMQSAAWQGVQGQQRGWPASRQAQAHACPLGACVSLRRMRVPQAHACPLDACVSLRRMRVPQAHACPSGHALLQ